MTAQRFTSALGEFDLRRYPRLPRDQLQAWDAADEYLLAHLAEASWLDELPAGSRVLAVNDAFGALAVALSGHRLVSWSDSWLAHQGALANSAANHCKRAPEVLPSTSRLSGVFDLVLIKVPRTLALLEHQLAGLQGSLAPHGRVLAAGMVKHIHTSTLDLFEQYLGPTTSSRARKKARLVFPETALALAGDGNASPYPDSYTWPGMDVELRNHANVFSRAQLDIGARAMLQALPGIPDSELIVDLGCGNGVLGIAAQLRQPGARLAFVDESYMAVASARDNWEAISQARLPAGCPAASFHNADALTGLDLVPDLVLCNPPFHQGTAVGDQVAWRMFSQCREKLRPGGELWVVGNRHMAYHAKLNKVFGNCRSVFSSRKFVVLVARKLA